VKQYWIPSHVRACSLPANTILLDLNRNRYFSIGARETRALFTLALNWSVANTYANDELQIELAETPLAPEQAVPIAEALVERGLLSRDAPTEDEIFRSATELGGALSSVGYELSRTASVQYGHVVGFLRACAWARRALRSRSLYSIASELIHAKALTKDGFDDERTIELVCIFRRLRSYTFGTRDRCLFHALALVRFLARYQIFPTWIVGVRDQPWAAHSWVQQGSMILDGSPEQVCEYTPILVI
jgi:hypothetical protein